MDYKITIECIEVKDGKATLRVFENGIEMPRSPVYLHKDTTMTIVVSPPIEVTTDTDESEEQP